MVMHKKLLADSSTRRDFVGGSDARIIMGQDEKALRKSWSRESGIKAGERILTQAR
jgi:hypothetical protein